MVALLPQPFDAYTATEVPEFDANVTVTVVAVPVAAGDIVAEPSPGTDHV